MLHFGVEFIPIELQIPAKKRIVPASGYGQILAIEVNGGNDRNTNGRDAQNAVHDQIAPHHTVHSAQDRIKNHKHGEQQAIKMGHILRWQGKRQVRGKDIPGDEQFDEFAQPHKTVSQKSQTAQ